MGLLVIDAPGARGVKLISQPVHRRARQPVEPRLQRNLLRTRAMLIQRIGNRFVDDLFDADLLQPALPAVPPEGQFALHVAPQPVQVRIHKSGHVNAGNLLRLHRRNRILKARLRFNRRAAPLPSRQESDSGCASVPCACSVARSNRQRQCGWRRGASPRSPRAAICPEGKRRFSATHKARLRRHLDQAAQGNHVRIEHMQSRSKFFNL